MNGRRNRANSQTRGNINRSSGLRNNYRTRNFHAQFTALASELFKIFNSPRTPRQLRGLNVHGKGNWIIIPLTRLERRSLNTTARRFLANVERRYLFPGFTYRWGQFNQYMALGPWTINAGQCYGSNNNYGTITFHL